jgi:polynucleotide 5'-hydroxyl-kinase GRC3/NOL9
VTSLNEHDLLVERAVRDKRTVLLLGGLDSGKSSLGRSILGAALAAGRTGAFLDGDLGQKTVGPPATVTLKHVRTLDDLEPDRIAEPDGLSFVGSTSPQGHLLPLVTGISRLLFRSRDEGSDLVVIDTSGMVTGIYGQLVKFHKVEMLEPDIVVGLRRGEELDPVLGVIQRFFSTEVVSLAVHPDAKTTSIERRAENRKKAMRRYFDRQLQRFRIKPTVFMPSLPPLFDPAHLDRLLVGLSDGAGRYTGVGYLEHSPQEGLLRLISPVADAPKALRLGSVRLEEDYRVRRVDLRNLFGTE